MSGSSDRRKKIAFLLTHPIQYLSPFFTYMAEFANDRIEFIVFYQSDCSLNSYKDKNMGCQIKWDIDMLDGYNYQFLPCLGTHDRLTYIKPYNYGLKKILSNYLPDALVVLGYNRPFHWAAMLIAKRLGIDVYIRDDSNLICKERPYTNIVAKKIFFRIIDRYIKGYLSVGKMNYEYYRYHSIAKHKLHNVPWAVNNDFFRTQGKGVSNGIYELRRKLGIDDTSPVLLYVGKLLRAKGVLELLDAFDLLSETTSLHPYLILVGNGELFAETQARKHKNSHIIPVGFKKQTELLFYYALCDLFILPSHTETWGLVVNEAMAAGKAVIVSNKVGCWPDLVEDGKNGRVFTAGDVPSLLSALIDCLRDPERLLGMGKAGSAKIDEFSYQVDIERIIKIVHKKGAVK